MHLTARQHEIVKFIWHYRKRHGLAPTLAEIASHMGISKVTVHEHIAQLERKGCLEKEPFLSRSTRLTRRMQRELERMVEDQSRFVGMEEPDALPVQPAPAAKRRGKGPTLPLLGHIAAGRPLEAVEEREVVDVAEMCHADRASYVLRVKGDSMTDDGIRDGDYVLVERRNDAKDGETVVAILDGNEATLKRFYREPRKKRFRLEPANVALKPTHVDKLEIRGVVVGVLRRY